MQHDLDTGVRATKRFRDQATIKPGHYFILSGQKAYVASREEDFRNAQGRLDARLRVVFDNGTETNMLRRSLERVLQKDEAGRRISEPTAGPLFAEQAEEDDVASSAIYVLYSKADIPFVAENRDLVHKIGVTGGKVRPRIANATLDPTFLMAEVETVAEYKLYNIKREKLEKLIQRVFSPARLDVEIKDRFGNPVVPREWFLVPLHVVEQAVEKIRNGTITGHSYDPKAAALVGDPL